MARGSTGVARRLLGLGRRRDADEQPGGSGDDVSDPRRSSAPDDGAGRATSVGRGAVVFTAPALRTVEAYAPTIGEYCELDLDAIEFPHPDVAEVVPDSSRRRSGAPTHPVRAAYSSEYGAFEAVDAPLVRTDSTPSGGPVAPPAPVSALAAVSAQERAAARDRAAVRERAEQEFAAEQERFAGTQRAAELERAAEQERLAEQERVAENERVAERERLAEQERADRARRAEEARVAEQVRLAEQARLAEEARLLEEARLVEQARAAEEARRAEQARLAEEARLAEQARAAEQARLAEQASRAEQARLAEQEQAEQEQAEQEQAERARIAEQQAERARAAEQERAAERDRVERQRTAALAQVASAEPDLDRPSGAPRLGTVVAVAPIIDEVCALDPDAIEFPNPAVAAFVPDLSGADRPLDEAVVAVDEGAVEEPARSAVVFPWHTVPDSDVQSAPAQRSEAPAARETHRRPAPPIFPDRAPILPQPPVVDDREDAPRPRRRALAAGIGIGAAVLVIGGALVAVPLLSGGDDDAPAAGGPATEEAVAWLVTSLDPSSVLVVEDDLVQQVTEAGHPADTVVSESTLASADPDSAWRAADYVLATPALTSTATGEVETALENSEVVASFGGGGSAVEVRRVLDEGIEQATATAAVRTASRASAGGQLAGNPALTTTPPARALLEEGRVDARLLLMLGQQLAASPLAVTDFPAGADEPEGVRHRMVLSGFNGAPVPGDAAATAAATSWLDSQTGDFVPASVETTPQGLLVTFDLDEPSGLLPAP